MKLLRAQVFIAEIDVELLYCGFVVPCRYFADNNSL